MRMTFDLVVEVGLRRGLCAPFLYFRRYVTRTLCLFIILFFSCEDAIPDSTARFEVTIQNLSSGEFATGLSKGIYLLKKDGFPLYFSGAQDYGEGLEELAEDGEVAVLVDNLSLRNEVIEVDSFRLLLPGEQLKFNFSAEYGTFFNFATMFIESNDLFYSFNEDGIPLFEPNGEPVKGDFTSLIWLWDLGTEFNEAPFEGDNQAVRQNNPGEGDFEGGRVRLVNDTFSYPSRYSTIRVTINPL